MSVMAKTIRTEVKLIGAEACKEIHKRGRFSFHNDFGWTGIPRNATIKKHATIVGYSDNKGNCNHGTWNDGYNNAVVQTEVTITTTDYVALARVYQMDNPKIALRNHLSCNLNDEYCGDAQLGDFYWNKNYIQPCSRRGYDVLYEGPAEILKSKDATKTFNLTYLLVTEGTYAFGLALREPKRLCHLQAYTTDQERISHLHPARTRLLRKSRNNDTKYGFTNVRKHQTQSTTPHGKVRPVQRTN